MTVRSAGGAAAVVALLGVLTGLGRGPGSGMPGLRAGAPAGPGSGAVSDSVGCWVRGAREDLELRVSKLDSASVELTAGTVRLCYSRPRKLGRPVMGRLVPYGEPWRLGANEATAIHVPFPAEIAGVAVEPGWYSLYAVPGRDVWELVVNGEARRWGIPVDEEVRAQDVGSGTVPVTDLSETVERLTIELERAARDSAEIVISWERTRVRAPVVQRAGGSP